MKILAATPTSYSGSNYIAELNDEELAALTVFYAYGKIPVMDAKGVPASREKDKLVAGDFIRPETAKETLDAVRAVIDERDAISKAAASIRSSLTRLQATIQNANQSA